LNAARSDSKAVAPLLPEGGLEDLSGRGFGLDIVSPFMGRGMTAPNPKSRNFERLPEMNLSLSIFELHLQRHLKRLN
jgi:hypothetical protein